MTLDILICSLNKGVVRVQDVLLPPQDNVRYIVSYQYTDERYLDLIPKVLATRTDVAIYTYKGQGLSANRNLALEKDKSDIVNEDFDIIAIPAQYSVSALEMACRRTSVQGKIRFDERFGLGTKFLTCGEEEIWLEDALHYGLKMHYYPEKIVETSMNLKKSMVYIDAGVQRSRGAISYYRHGMHAWWDCLCFAIQSTRKGYCHFFPIMRHLVEGIRYMKKTSR